MHPLAGYGLVGLFVITVLMSCGKALPDPVAQAYEDLPDRIDYNFHVQPILSDRCYQCHGPDPASRKADLRLDIEKEAFSKLSNGHKALVRGRPSASHATTC